MTRRVSEGEESDLCSKPIILYITLQPPAPFLPATAQPPALACSPSLPWWCFCPGPHTRSYALVCRPHARSYARAHTPCPSMGPNGAARPTPHPHSPVFVLCFLVVVFDGEKEGMLRASNYWGVDARTAGLGDQRGSGDEGVRHATPGGAL